MNSYLYLTTLAPKDRPLIEAESEVLLNAVPDEVGVVLCDTHADLSNAAYLKSGMRVIAETEDVPSLLNYLDHAHVHQEGFRVSVVKRLDDGSHDSAHIASEVGARISGQPNLGSPSCVFQVVLCNRKVWLGRIHTEAENSWVNHARKPVVTSSSLPTRLARLMVNLAAPFGCRILDPCCGTGTLLIEAASIGFSVEGSDSNAKMVQAARTNLEFFGYHGSISVADARTVGGSFDTIITDLPYGRMLPASSSLYREILTNLRHLAPYHIIVTATPLTPLLDELGYTVVKRVDAPKSRFIRWIHIAQYQAP